MIEIAKILKPHGLNGEIKVECFTHDLDFWRGLKTVSINDEVYEVKRVRFYKKFGYLKLVGVEDIECAQKFRNAIIYVELHALQPTGQDEFLIADLEGCDLFDDKGKMLGVVESVEKYGAADIINFLSGGARYSFPFVDGVVKEVDIKAKKIVVFGAKLKEVLV